MKRKTTRLTFTEEELANPDVRRAAKKATRAADRADKAKAKLSTRAPPKRGLKMDADKAKERSAQLRFGKAEFGEEIVKPKRRKPGAEALLGGEAHRQIDKQNQDENAGVQAAHEGERLAEGTAKKLKDGKYSKKLKAYKKAERLDKAAAAKAAQFASTHAHMILMGGVLVLLILVIFCFITSCSVFFPGGMGTVWTTSYTAEDEDILGAEADYKALEEALRAEIAAIPSSYPDYDEYTWDLDPITHDPHQLAAVLTAIHEAYTRGEVQGTMQSIFDQQYELILSETIEIRTRTETRTGTDPTTGDTYTYEVEVQYEWKILNITLLNFGIDSVARGMLSGDDLDRYDILQETQGNRPELFGGVSVGYGSDGSGEAGIDYEVPAEALSDPEFAAMLEEAEKHLGTPYVWGGSSPETGFDCSGYVCWVLNQSGWDVGRTTANGLWQQAAKVSEHEAKPGDLVFFQGTYDTPGASHVGLYVGDGMMISAGDPIKYSNIHSSYWDDHLLGFGRIPK